MRPLHVVALVERVDDALPVRGEHGAQLRAQPMNAYYYSVPAGCPIVHTYPRPYYYCGGVYYEKQMQGDSVVYVIVHP